mgnify:CR=1 FL=1
MSYNRVTAGRKAAKWMQSRITNILKHAGEKASGWIPYNMGGFKAPVNALTGRPFSGWNFMAMLLSGYPSHGWLTIKQVNDLGGRVIKGEHGTPTFFAKSDRVADEQTGEMKQTFVYKGYTHFNIMQCVGLPEHITKAFTPEPMEQWPTGNDLAPVKAFIDALGAKIKNTDMTRAAAYSPATDTIIMPDLSMFPNEEYYHSTTLHEIAHWTGHKDRLARKGIVESSPKDSASYAREELVADFFAGAMSALFGIEHAPVNDEVTLAQNHDRYLGHWLSRLQDERYTQELLTATGQAYKAIMYAQDKAGIPLIPISPARAKDLQPVTETVTETQAESEQVTAPVEVASDKKPAKKPAKRKAKTQAA